MNKLKDSIAYICENYPCKDELSKARLTKMIYLADWKSAIQRGKQISTITWYFNHYGPYVDDVIQTVRADPNFELRSAQTQHGSNKEIITLKAKPVFISLDDEDIGILDFVIETTRTKYWNAFIRLVYSTYPVLSTPQYSSMDLVELAKQYKIQAIQD